MIRSYCIKYPEKSVNNITQSETKYNKNSTLCFALLKTNAITVYTHRYFLYHGNLQLYLGNSSQRA